MQLHQCVYCGRNRTVRPDGVCPPCQDEEHRLLKQARIYLYEKKDASLEETAEELQIPVSRLERWIRERRLYWRSPDVYERLVEERASERILRKALLSRLIHHAKLSAERTYVGSRMVCPHYAGHLPMTRS